MQPAVGLLLCIGVPAPRSHVKTQIYLETDGQKELTWHLGASHSICQMIRQSSPDSTTPRTFTTSQLCKVAGVTRGQLRLYEREGLIAPPKRTAAGYRCYEIDASMRLRAILLLKEVGFTLAEIGLLLDERDMGNIGRQELQDLSSQLVRRIDERVLRLQVVRKLAAPLALGDMSELEDPDCTFLTEFLSAELAMPQARRA